MTEIEQAKKMEIVSLKAAIAASEHLLELEVINGVSQKIYKSIWDGIWLMKRKLMICEGDIPADDKVTKRFRAGLYR